jgi:hypothetical protein
LNKNFDNIKNEKLNNYELHLTERRMPLFGPIIIDLVLKIVLEKIMKEFIFIIYQLIN